ncbi:FUSC family protein [Alkalilimnicola sp. S0819]|uniref:FUSC family protein n=1 Tax=Alkalilimnicola sp. S0819 TaxID=2613922 RepID=UPI001869BE23|nr:FUSC family protein [Alkalilimnicola sp. S0819]
MSLPAAGAAAWFARLGFDPARLGFGLRTALASCLAMWLAWLAGLEHPQWSAMTVWAASQPLRGMLLEKSLLRALGTLLGIGVGILLVLLVADNTLVLVLGLALWVGLCAGAGNALSGLLAYGALLAGYSASMLALLHTTAPTGIMTMGLDRLLTVLLGIAVALLVGLLFGSRRAEDDIAIRARRSTAVLLRHLAARLSPRHEAPRIDKHALLSEIAALEETMDIHGAGSRRSRHSARSIRAVLAAEVAAILWLQRQIGSRLEDEAIAETLAAAARALEETAPIDQVLPVLARAKRAAHRVPGLTSVIGQLSGALAQRQRFRTRGSTEAAKLKRHFILHRDWAHARRALIRTSSVLLLVGLIWVVTGWHAGAYVMLSTSVTLFSTFENPAWIMRIIFFWHAVGALAALLCQWLVWPAATAQWQLVAMLVPFVLLGVLPFAHRRTMVGSMDYAMILLLLSQPVYPPRTDFGASLEVALAVVAGPVLAFLAFKLLFPVDARRRRDMLRAMMIRELQAMAADPRAPARAGIWRARLHHRVLKLVHWSNRADLSIRPTTAGSLAVLEVGEAIIALRERLLGPRLSSWQARRVRVVLRRIEGLREDPVAAAQALARLAARLRRQGLPAAELLAGAARALRDNWAFFRGDGPGRESGTLSSAQAN